MLISHFLIRNRNITMINGRILLNKQPHIISQKTMFYDIKGHVLQTKKTSAYAQNADKQVISL